MTISKFITVALSSVLTAQAMKIGVISDFHLNPDYSPTASEDDNCQGSSNQVSADDIAPIGRINCDPSPTLVDFMF